MRAALALLLVLTSSPAFAQTLESTIDLSSLGWGQLDMPLSVETDGDLSTREWLVRSIETNKLIVLAERDGRLCAGDWFVIGKHPFVAMSLQRVGLVHKLFVRDPFAATREVKVLALITPTCQSSSRPEK